MQELKVGDHFMSRLVASRVWLRWTRVALVAAAIGAVWFRLLQGRTEQGLPAAGALLALYGFAMAAASARGGSRAAWVLFGLMVLGAFAPRMDVPLTRLVGAGIAGCALGLLLILHRIPRESGIRPEGPVLESSEIHH